ncbi:superoxide dismutase [Pelosinus propionicus]|uniref:superoxide dismutase n=1 Tax=Pelosinus propionicus DSM 13327 TaxID=1123291 RepID=A0A1I4HHP2_9FIRM|nr:Fe-Mn family superoxide dismutase [Pelosinus propionicus]SFL41725.1 superoxide dismutase, Fe-Mn family [Pelosinus propionicus DSM 13327]
MSYQAQDFGHLLGMQGFSENLLNNHFTLYHEHVERRNQTAAKLKVLAARGQEDTPEYASLKRCFGSQSSDMRLHELYFENLGGQNERSSASCLIEKLTDNFGSYQAWKEDFKITASISGVGWAILCQDHNNGKLNNLWLDEHHAGIPADYKPLLVLDVWEHSYMMDYGFKRPEYLETFFKNIDWDVVDRRLIV